MASGFLWFHSTYSSEESEEGSSEEYMYSSLSLSTRCPSTAPLGSPEGSLASLDFWLVSTLNCLRWPRKRKEEDEEEDKLQARAAAMEKRCPPLDQASL